MNLDLNWVADSKPFILTLMKTVFDGSQPGLESPILVSRGVINRVEVYDL